MTTMRVLLAEHDPWTRQVLSDLLEGAGCSVQHASNGMAALRLATQSLPHIVLLGANLPEIPAATVQQELETSARTQGIGVAVLEHGAASNVLDDLAVALARAHAALRRRRRPVLRLRRRDRSTPGYARRGRWGPASRAAALLGP